MRKQILILDDDASVRDSLQKVLEEAGYDVAAAGDGKAGLSKLRQRHFDLLLLDLDLPDMTGFDILDTVRELLSVPPVIILTGVAEACAPGSLVGAAMLLDKPVDALLLLKKIREVLNQPARPQSAGAADPPAPALRDSAMGGRPARAVGPGQPFSPAADGLSLPGQAAGSL